MPININMRCIEIMISSAIKRLQRMININMRCIEIELAEELELAEL